MKKELIFMSNLKTRINEFLLFTHVMIENVSDPGIKTALASYGFSGEKLLDGKKLYDEAIALQNLQKQKYGERIAATAELEQAWKIAKQQYMKTLKIARVAFRENVKADKATILYGIRKQSLSGWLEQAQIFYTNILNDSELMNILSMYGYSPEKLRRESTLIDEVLDKSLRQKQVIGEAQEATEARDKKISELAKWVSDLRAVAKVALAEDPQQLEKLGVRVKGKG
jgi:hypothetical protein